MIFKKVGLLLIFSLLLFNVSLIAQNDSSEQKNKWEIEAEEAFEFGRNNIYANPDSIIIWNKQLIPHSSTFIAYRNAYDLHNVIGLAYQTKSNVDSSDFHFSKADSIARFHNDTFLIVMVTHNSAINIRLKGNYKEALEVLFKNIETCRLIENDNFYGLGLSEIAIAFMLSGNWDKALEYLHVSLEFHRKNGNDAQIGTTFGSMGYVYESNDFPKKNQDSALKYIDSSIYYFRKTGDLVRERIGLSQRCALLQTHGLKNKESINCYREVIELHEKFNDHAGIALCEMNIGCLYVKMQQYSKALKYLDPALKKHKQLKKTRFVKEIYKALSVAEFRLKNYKAAFICLDSALSLEEYLRGESINSEMANLETKYQLSEKERLILEEKSKSEQLTQEKEIAQLEVQKRNNWILFLLGFLLIGTLSVYLFVQNNKKKQQLKEAELLKQEKQLALKSVLNAQEEERKRIAKDLHDGIGQKLSGLKMGWKRISNNIEEATIRKDISELTATLENSADEIRAISHKMMPIALREVGISAALQSMLENTFHYSDMKYTFDQSNAEKRFDEAVEVTLYRIAQELVNNAIKHSNAKEINVQLVHSNNHLILMVQDDGRGVDLESFKKGHGFMNIDSRLSVNDGEINLESSENQGLFAQVRIKLT